MIATRLVLLTFLLTPGLPAQLQQEPAPCLTRPPSERPYTRNRLLDLVASQGTNRAEYLIRTCGVSVTFSDELEAGLKKAGAAAKVVQAVRETAPKPAVDTLAGKIAVHAKDQLTYVYIPPGSFRMGCSEGDNECGANEKPAHPVRITKGFWIGQTEVTVEAYSRYARASSQTMPPEPVFKNTKLNPRWSGGSLPMTMVSWTNARDYCVWAGLHLPTEAQWEYAARGGTVANRYGAIGDISWYGDNSGPATVDATTIWSGSDNDRNTGLLVNNGNRPHPVARKAMNAFKLYDMLGNAAEWTADWYQDPYYKESPEDDPQGPSTGEYHSIRGGNWMMPAKNSRVSNRGAAGASNRSMIFGFRCSGEKIE